jgi:aminoglycoside phosphotransferase (APT) family kinase protein
MSAELDTFDSLLDWAKLNAWLVSHDVPGSGPAKSVQRLKGGMQNSVFLIERDGASIVLRRPGKRLRPESNETMRREARVLQALTGSPVPHPRFYALCDDDSVIGAFFYVMEPLEGFAPGGPLKGEYGTDPSWRRAMGPELVKGAAALAAIDVNAVGLGDLGKPTDWHARQVSRWRSQLEGYATTFPGFDPKALPYFDEIGRWLSNNLPSNRRIGLMHGDFQFANVMFSLKAPKLSGVIDWELATLGDPMIDLGWILTSWTEPGDPEVGRSPLVTPWDSFGSRADLVKQYGELTGRDMSEMPWFFALACYKLSCLLSGTVAASKTGKVPADVGEKVQAYATWLTTKGRQVIAG